MPSIDKCFDNDDGAGAGGDFADYIPTIVALSSLGGVTHLLEKLCFRK